MSITPQYYEYSIPPSPAFPPVPRVSPASSISSLHSLYEQDGERLTSTFRYTKSSYYEYDRATHSPIEGYEMSTGTSLLFTDDDLAKAFSDRANITTSPRSSPSGRLVHDCNDPSSPWKRSLRIRYSDMNMRDSNTLALQEASDLLSKDMASYVRPL